MLYCLCTALSTYVFTSRRGTSPHPSIFLPHLTPSTYTLHYCHSFSTYAHICHFFSRSMPALIASLWCHLGRLLVTYWSLFYSIIVLAQVPRACSSPFWRFVGFCSLDYVNSMSTWTISLSYLGSSTSS